MKELKFRAWNKKHLKYTKVLKIYFGSSGSNLGALVEDYETNYAFELQTNQVELEQYTGLKDQNGKEIYEGDIVKRVEDGGFDIVGAVEWSEKAARFWVKRYYYPNGKKWEVIGNIHENPELLGGEE